MMFTADSETTTIFLTGITGSQYIGLDNVSVSAVPVPAALWLFGSGLIGLIGMKRKSSNGSMFSA